MIRFDEASDVRQIINLIVNSMSPGQKTNPQNYALRLRHMLTKEVNFSLLIEIFTIIKTPFSVLFMKLDNMDATKYINESSNGTYIKSILFEC